jgi:hypothetical protein
MKQGLEGMREEKPERQQHDTEDDRRATGTRAELHAPRHAAPASISAARQAAIASSRVKSDLRSRASRAGGRKDKPPASAAPAYSSAAVQKLPTPAPNFCTSGALAPNSSAAPRAIRPPRSAGRSCCRVEMGFCPRDYPRGPK